MKTNETLLCQIKTVLGAYVKGWKGKNFFTIRIITSVGETKLREGKYSISHIS